MNDKEKIEYLTTENYLLRKKLFKKNKIIKKLMKQNQAFSIDSDPKYWEDAQITIFDLLDSYNTH